MCVCVHVYMCGPNQFCPNCTMLRFFIFFSPVIPVQARARTHTKQKLSMGHSPGSKLLSLAEIVISMPLGTTCLRYGISWIGRQHHSGNLGLGFTPNQLSHKRLHPTPPRQQCTATHGSHLIAHSCRPSLLSPCSQATSIWPRASSSA